MKDLSKFSNAKPGVIQIPNPVPQDPNLSYNLQILL